MQSDLAERLNAALSAIDYAKSELSIACATGTTESVEAAGDRYLDARQQMADVMNHPAMAEASRAAATRSERAKDA